jgi:SanA protein
MIKKVKKIVTIFAVTAVAVLVAVASVNSVVYRRGRALIRLPDEVKPAKVAVVFGAYVYPNGTPSAAVEDRLVTALDLYRAGKFKKFLISGDHGQDDYDEVNAMRAYLEAEGVPKADLFLDHAGFDTYNSLLRARDVFEAKDVILVTQEFHLPRALYIAQSLGLQAEGVVADRRILAGLERLELREVGARLKAFAEVTTNRSPVFRGPAIDLDGDALLTHDKE